MMSILDNLKLDYHHDDTFLEGRMFRADFELVNKKIVIEVHGGTFIQGRHQRPLGFHNDCVKRNLITLNGYSLLEFSTLHFKDVKSMSQLIKKTVKELSR